MHCASLHNRALAPIHHAPLFVTQVLGDHRPNTAINHSPSSVLANRYIADFFVEEARRNAHVFDDALAPFYSPYAYTPQVEGPLMDDYQAYLITFP